MLCAGGQIYVLSSGWRLLRFCGNLGLCCITGEVAENVAGHSLEPYAGNDRSESMRYALLMTILAALPAVFEA